MTTEETIQNLEIELKEKASQLPELKRKAEKVKVQDYELKTRTGATVKLSSLFNGKRYLIVVHNMGKSCPYCTLWADGINDWKPEYSY